MRLHLVSALGATLALTGSAFAQQSSGAAIVPSSQAVKEAVLQMKADKAGLQRALKRLKTDEAKLKSDAASGRMSAESKDAMKVYTDKKSVKGEKKDISADKAKVAQ